MRRGGGRRVPLEGRVRKSLFEILRENRVAVHGDVEFAERLAGDGTEAGLDRLAVEALDAFDRERADEVLRALLDCDEHGDVADLAAVVVLGARGHLHIAEAVRLVEVLDGFAVAPQKVLAEPAVRKLQEGPGLQVHALANRRCGEVAITVDLDVHQPVPRARR